MQNEVWKEIEFRGAVLAVSNLGRVMGPSGKILTQFTQEHGYKRISTKRRGKHIDCGVHRLMLMAFCPLASYEGMEASHIDGLSDNNIIENLVWKNHADNCSDMVKHGTMAFGEKNGNSQLTKEDIIQIRHYRKTSHLTFGVIGKVIGLHRVHVGDICAGRRWGHIPLSAAIKKAGEQG